MTNEIKALGALLGGGKDLLFEAGAEYASYVGVFLRYAGWALLLALALVVGVLVGGPSWLGSIGLLLFGGALLALFFVLVPALAAGNVVARVGPVRDALKALGVLAGLVGFLVYVSANVPSGTNWLSDVLSRLVLMLLTFAVLRALFQTPLLAAVLISGLVGLLANFLDNTFNRTLSRMPFVASIFDGRVSTSIVPQALELDMTLGVLRAEDRNAPALFLEGQPEWWCRATSDVPSGYRCFKEGGRDRTTNEVLVPISDSIVNDAISRLEAANREQAELAQRQIEAQREYAALAARQAAEAAEQERVQREQAYKTKYAAPAGQKSALSMVLLDDGALDSFVSVEAPRLAGVAVSARPLTTAAITDGIFTRLYAGEVAEYQRLGLAEHSNLIALGQLTERLTPINLSRGATRSDLSLSLRVYDTSTGVLVEDTTLTVEARERTVQLAQTRSREQMASELAVVLTRISE